MLDRDVAELYGVPTKVLNQTVKCFAVSTFDPLGIPELVAKLPS